MSQDRSTPPPYPSTPSTPSTGSTTADEPPVTLVQDLSVEPGDTTATELVPGMAVVQQTALDAGTVQSAQEPQPWTDPFDVVFRGYDRHQVDAHLQRLAVAFDELRAAYADADQRGAAAAAELERVRAELERDRPSFDALGERVSQMLGLAESEAAQLRADAEREVTEQRAAAEREAADIRSDARRDAEELGHLARHEVADLSQRRVELLAEIASTRDTLNQILGAASEQWPSLAPADEPAPPELFD
jgi:DivIVA domain-containing protein